ncbi:tetratricopeptide repeat protein [uncultured Sphingobacterium sp.]|jgi:tetratricopeptide (TPR) repeat protein|uniref:tetratricopeptide repeat protein n=1 Tax=uncultured Sphingobacterium sp. TaxID=182688 RepID=UPI003749C22C
MNKKVTLLIFGLTLVFNQVFGQTFKQQFNEFVSKKDTLGQQQLLDKWEKSDSNDPELYIAYFNYFVKKSVKEVVTLGQNPEGNDVLQIMDKDSSKKEPVAYLYGDTYYDQNILKKGFDYIDKGLSKYPNRLDMRFGKIYLLGQIENYEKFTAEIINTIDYSHVNKNKWTWADNKPLGDPENFMLSSIQDYQLQLYNTENDNLIENMKRIAEAVLKYYPEHIESLSNISIVFMLQKQYDKALDTLLKAEKLNPKDCIVLNNIAQTYKLKGDTINAIKYYKLTIQYGDDQAKNYANGQIEELLKK